MLEKIQDTWDKIQDLFDLSGDLWLGLFTTIILIRIVLVLKGYHAISTSEAATYASAVGSFAYSNRGLK